LKRGEIWTIAGGPDYAGKPRPAVIVQDDRFDSTASVTVCAFTSNPTEGPLSRPLIEPSDLNKLRQASRIMVDKITTLPRRRVGARLGRLDGDDVARLERALLVFLGMAGPLPNQQGSGQ
jgi:mRNA interferase MazF